MIPTLSPSANLFLSGLSRIQRIISTATAQLSSGYRINQASDDPDQVSPLLEQHARLSHNQAVASNLNRVLPDVSSADQAVSTAIQLLEQARSIGAQGATSTTSNATRQDLAQQIQSIQEQMTALANTHVTGRYIFGGDQDVIAPYRLDSNPPVTVGKAAPATAVLAGDAARFDVQTASGLISITVTAAQAGTLDGQIDYLNSQLQGTGISASLDASGHLEFQSAATFSVSAQANGHANLVTLGGETANNIGLNHYEFAGRTPAASGGGNTIKITVAGVSAIATLPNAQSPQQVDVDSINAALQAAGITRVTAVLDRTVPGTISLQGMDEFSVSDDYEIGGTYIEDGHSVASNGVDRLVMTAATRRIELSDNSSSVLDQTAADLFDHRNVDDTPAVDNVFSALNSLRIALADTSNPDQQSAIKNAQSSLESASGYLNAKEAFYGNAQNRISAATARINAENSDLQQRISDIGDTDFVQTTLQLTSAETQNSAAMAAQAKLPRSTLFDFLG